MALPENLLLKVNIDSLRADPNIIDEHEENPLSILTDEQDSKLVDIATLRKYDRVLRGTDLGETFDTLKEIQVNIKNEEVRAEKEEEKLHLEIQTEKQRAQNAESTLNQKIDAEIERAEEAENGLNSRLRTVEIFFEGAYAEDGKPLTEALDTLEEIQDYIDTHGQAAAKMISDISQNASNINTLEAWKKNHEEDHANKQAAITNAIKLAKEEAIKETLALIQLANNTEIDELFNQGGAG